MLLVEYVCDNEFCITAVADITFSVKDNRIYFTPLSDNCNCFYIADCSLDDFETISGAVQHRRFVNLYVFGYKVYFD